MASERTLLGVIGGSGLYAMPGLSDVREERLTTPFGTPSGLITLGRLGAVPVAFLPRHGPGHTLSPTEVPARANVYALKQLGAQWIIAVSAVGSLRAEYAPCDLLIPDQLVDRTSTRPSSFFTGGVVAHIPFADPFCPHLSGLLWDALVGLSDVRGHRGGTYVCIEGPAFSTRAESRLYRQWGCDVIGMTALPEAKLAREAGLCYATIACVTDYDAWHPSEAPVTVATVVTNLARNVANAQRIIAAVAARLPPSHDDAACDCARALASAIITAPERIGAELRTRYALLLGGRLP